jgi:hypothetical protein
MQILSYQEKTAYDYLTLQWCQVAQYEFCLYIPNELTIIYYIRYFKDRYFDYK